MPRNAVMDAGARGMGWLLQAGWRAVPEKFKSLTFPASTHYDFRTPEYASFDEIQQKKWEATRGVGHSFGANRNERPQDIITATGVIRMLCDVVSKNGNLLIGIGPDPDGSIPEQQQAPLRGLGEWLAINGEAIYGTPSLDGGRYHHDGRDRCALHAARRSGVRDPARSAGCAPVRLAWGQARW
jgi:alpha-L-fucosidase